MVHAGQSSEKAALIYQRSDLERSRSVACDAFMAEVNGRVALFTTSGSGTHSVMPHRLYSCSRRVNLLTCCFRSLAEPMQRSAGRHR